MRRRLLSPPTLCLLAALSLLAACEDAEQRAARHLDNALGLLEEGEPREAALELRNVLRNVPNHREALAELAALQRAQGADSAAYGTYTQLVENHSEAVEARVALAEIAIEANRWDEAETHVRAAEEGGVADAELALVRAALAYRDAAQAEDPAAAAQAAKTARAQLQADGQTMIAWRILIDEAFAFHGPETGLERVEAALAELPDSYGLHLLKVRTLNELGRTEAVGPALEELAARFPDRDQPLQMLVRWYLALDDTEAVERVLRGRADAAAADLSDKLTLVRFLRETRGSEATLAELDRLIAAEDAESAEATEAATTLRGLRATVLFDTGRRDEAIAAMESAIEAAPETAEADDLRVALARMYRATDRSEDAAAAIDTVLEGDPGHVEAVKMRAQTLIGADRVEEAIRALRRAQAAAPRDPELTVLMARAHARAGQWDLAADRYATAVDITENAPRESLLYAEFLAGRGQLETAETVLSDALNRAPGNAELLSAIAELQLRRERFEAAGRSIARLRGLGTDGATATAERLEAELLLRQDRLEESLARLEDMAAQGRGDADALAELVRAKVAAGERAEAVALIERQLETFPDDPVLRFLRAGLHVAAGELEAAEAGYRGLVEDYPAAAPPLRVLYALLRGQGRDSEAVAVVEAAREAAPEALMPRLILAERAELAGDTATAIALYEDLYAQDGDNLVVANNLANLLAMREDDAKALERAYTVARRLRDTGVPAFQDTYGWIAYQRGEYAEALAHLEPAAEALPEEPTVLYHLGMTYLALERPDEARTTLERALELAGETGLPDAARTALEGL